MRRWLILYAVLNACLTGSVSAETEPVSFPEIPALADARSWRRLLFEGRNALGARRGVIDSPGFYLSPEGKADPEAELRAFLLALRAPSTPEHPDAHAACRFPARTSWVRTNLPRFTFEAPPCPAWEEFQRTHVYRGASLVFSSFYVEHPSSLFGHTFLALHKKDNPAPLLDDALNYGAVPDTNNPLAYAWLGLVGGFPGTFSLMPFYVKVQEYAHSEHRDIWSYPLALSPEEMQTLTQVMWEVGSASADYYFFDENCSSLMLYLLAAVTPRLNPPESAFWVIPGDAVRTAVASGLASEVRGTPSSLGRFLSRYETLSDDEENIFATWARKQPAPLHAKDTEARLLDTYLDYMDYREKVAADWNAGAWERPRRELLARRAELRVRDTAPDPIPPAYRAPHLGHGSFRLGAGVGTNGDDRFSSFFLRPALHDLLNQPDGYHESLAVEMSALRVDVRGAHTIVPVAYKLVAVTSLPRLPLLIQPMAWDFALGWRRRSDSGETYVAYAPGWNVPFGDGLDVFALARVEVGSSRRDAFASMAPVFGLRVRPSRSFTLLANVERTRRVSRAHDAITFNQGGVTLSWAAGEHWDLRLETHSSNMRKEAVTSVYYAF